MIIKSKLPAVLLLLPLLYAAAAAAEEAPFTYSNDWRLVSAPPPPGPYNAVNIDPRVPRQEAIPLMTTGEDALEEPLPEEVIANPPAAGSPAFLPAMRAPAMPYEERGFDTHAPIPGAYERSMPRLQNQARMPPSRQPSVYENMPPSGYYRSPAMQQEMEVPPPPVYDAQTGESDDSYTRP